MVKRKRSACQLEDIAEDGILSSIVSSLPIRDAVTTSILSRRWRYIWRHMPKSNLIFDAHNMLKTGNLDKVLEIRSFKKLKALLRERTKKFIRSVDEFLKHYQGKGLETFKVNFYIHEKYANHLDRWVGFGITSNAKEFVLKLQEPSFRPLLFDEPYHFPFHLFAGKKGSSIEHLCLERCSLEPPPNFDGFNFLKVLDLNAVVVTDRGIQNLLSNCSVIESLSIKRCTELVNLKISHPLCHLNYLNVEVCYDLENIEICAISLTTFQYVGHQVCFVFREASLLTKAYIWFFGWLHVMQYPLTGLSRDLPHLKTLFLEIANNPKDGNLPIISNGFSHLQHLVIIVVSLSMDDDLLWLVSLLNAAPYVEKFELHLDNFSRPDKKRKIKRPLNCSHSHLKEVEITGFTGGISQIELARYLLHNGIALDSMIIYQKERKYKQYDKWKWRKTGQPDDVIRRKAYEYLCRKAPSSANLEIF